LNFSRSLNPFSSALRITCRRPIGHAGFRAGLGEKEEYRPVLNGAFLHHAPWLLWLLKILGSIGEA